MHHRFVSEVPLLPQLSRNPVHSRYCQEHAKETDITNEVSTQSAKLTNLSDVTLNDAQSQVIVVQEQRFGDSPVMKGKKTPMQEEKKEEKKKEKEEEEEEEHRAVSQLDRLFLCFQRLPTIPFLIQFVPDSFRF